MDLTGIENGGWDILVRKLSELMEGRFESGYIWGIPGLDARDTFIELQCFVDKHGGRSISGLLRLESRRPETGSLFLPIFSFKRRAGRKHWRLKCDENLVSHWLWKELRSLEREDGKGGLSEAEKDLILEDNLNQL